MFDTKTIPSFPLYETVPFFPLYDAIDHFFLTRSMARLYRYDLETARATLLQDDRWVETVLPSEIAAFFEQRREELLSHRIWFQRWLEQVPEHPDYTIMSSTILTRVADQIYQFDLASGLAYRHSLPRWDRPTHPECVTDRSLIAQLFDVARLEDRL